MANIEEAVSRLDSEVQVLKTRTTKLEKIAEELEEGFQYNEDDVRDLASTLQQETGAWGLRLEEAGLVYGDVLQKRKSKILRETRESECTIEERSEQRVVFENTREVMYKFLEEKLKIEQLHEKIELQRIHR